MRAVIGQILYVYQLQRRWTSHLLCVEGHVGDDGVYVGRDLVVQLLGLANGYQQDVLDDILAVQDVNVVA